MTEACVTFSSTAFSIFSNIIFSMIISFMGVIFIAFIVIKTLPLAVSTVTLGLFRELVLSCYQSAYECTAMAPSGRNVGSCLHCKQLAGRRNHCMIQEGAATECTGTEEYD